MGRIPTKEIYSILAELKGTVGLYIEDLKTGETLNINPETVFPACSVIKIPMLGLLLKDSAEGRVDIDVPHIIAQENRCNGTGILCDLAPIYNLTLRDLGKLMIIMSDNIATNEVMDVLGVDRFHSFCAEMGIPGFVWQRKMMDFDAIRQGKNNYLTPAAAGKAVSEIARGTFVSKEISEVIWNFMCAQKYRNKLPSIVPAAPSYSGIDAGVPEGMVRVANKTGDLVGIQHDVGIFDLPNGDRYVIAMFTKDLESDLDGITAIGKVSLAVYNAFK